MLFITQAGPPVAPRPLCILSHLPTKTGGEGCGPNVLSGAVMWLPPPLEALTLRAFPDPGRRAVALKAVSFALVGVINAAVDFGVFSFFYYYLGFPIIVSNMISWLVAVTGSYVINSMTTFAAESGRKLRLRSYATFLLAQVAGFFANTATVVVVSYSIPALLHVFVGPGATLHLGDHVIDPVLVGKVLAIGASFLVNFTLSHFVVFRSGGPSATH
jgi:putative flippase GtrA